MAFEKADVQGAKTARGIRRTYLALPEQGPPLMYSVLDVAFIVFHSAVVFFNLFGWMWRRTRRLHLLVIGLTILSWFGLGAIYGWGYCPSTDWHWQVKRRLGETGLPSSYVKYYLDAVTGISWDPTLVDAGVLVLGLGAFVISIYVNGRDWRRARSG